MLLSYIAPQLSLYTFNSWKAHAPISWSIGSLSLTGDELYYADVQQDQTSSYCSISLRRSFLFSLQAKLLSEDLRKLWTIELRWPCSGPESVGPMTARNQDQKRSILPWPHPWKNLNFKFILNRLCENDCYFRNAVRLFRQ